jgi:hypothetical protein
LGGGDVLIKIGKISLILGVVTAVFIIAGCSFFETQQPKFLVTNPNSLQEESWVKKEGLPEFSPSIHSDGCSGGMSAIYAKLIFLHADHGNTLRWRKCCEVHDRAYYYGGSKEEKKVADKQLNACVTKIIGSDHLGRAMQIAVEVGGGPNLPTTYRWGYGEDYRCTP